MVFLTATEQGLLLIPKTYLIKLYYTLIPSTNKYNLAMI